MQPERLGSQRLATEIFKDAAVVMLNRTLKLLPVLQPRRDGVAIGARQQLNAVDVAGQRGNWSAASSTARCCTALRSSAATRES
jgi:hypothetical protein